MNSFMGGIISLDKDSRHNTRVTGNGSYRPSFAPIGNFKVYFCTDFSLPVSKAELFDAHVHEDAEATTLTGGWGGKIKVTSLETLPESVFINLIFRLGCTHAL